MPAIKMQGKQETERVTYIPNTTNRGSLRVSAGSHDTPRVTVDLFAGKKTVVPKVIADQLWIKHNRGKRAVLTPRGDSVESGVASGGHSKQDLEQGEYSDPVDELPKSYTIMFHDRGD